MHFWNFLCLKTLQCFQQHYMYSLMICFWMRRFFLIYSMVARSLDLGLEPSGNRLPDRKVELASSGVSSQGGKCW